MFREDHVAGLPLCPATNITLIDGKFYLDDLQHVVFEPATCRLSRLTAREARRFALVLLMSTFKFMMVSAFTKHAHRCTQLPQG